jgi:predicted ester cyclase
VATRITMRGTHQGEFMGVAPTGKRVKVIAIPIARIEYGKIAESTGQSEMVQAYAAAWRQR